MFTEYLRHTDESSCCDIQKCKRELSSSYYVRDGSN